MIKELVDNVFFGRAQFLKNVEHYIKRGLETGSAIYFYAVACPLQDERDIDKLSWIRDVKHEEYDMVALNRRGQMTVYCQPTILGDKVIKLDLTDRDVKKVFDEKFKIGTTWVKEDIPFEIFEKSPLFVKEAGYEFYNFVITKDDEVIVDALLYGGGTVNIRIAEEIVDEVDKEYPVEREKKRNKWKRIIFPFRH